MRSPHFTFIHVPFYYENFLYFFPPRPAGDGTHAFGFPQGDTPMAMMSVADVGLIVARLFEHPDAYVGKTLQLAAVEEPVAVYADAMTRATGATIRYTYVPRETFAALGFPGAEDLADMFEYYRTVMPSRRREIEECRALAPELQSFEAWTASNAGRLRAIIRESGAETG